MWKWSGRQSGHRERVGAAGTTHTTTMDTGGTPLAAEMPAGEPAKRRLCSSFHCESEALCKLATYAMGFVTGHAHLRAWVRPVLAVRAQHAVWIVQISATKICVSGFLREVVMLLFSRGYLRSPGFHPHHVR